MTKIESFDKRRAENRDKALAQKRAYKIEHKAELALRRKIKRTIDPEGVTAKDREYYALHADRMRLARREGHSKNKDVENTISREYYLKNSLKVRAQVKQSRLDRGEEFQVENKARRRKALLKTYGLSMDEYESMNRTQRGVCAICGGINKSIRRLHVDHDHATKKVRGLLCSKCNVALGLLKDDAGLVMKAYQYLCKNRVLEFNI
jgi:hypothetical protein